MAEEDDRIAAFLLAARTAQIVDMPGGSGILIAGRVYRIEGPEGSEREVAELLRLAMRSCVLG